jgi:hypothetical protein
VLGNQPAENNGVPLAPQIFSPTHPDQDKWYSNNNPKFNWKLSPDINGTRILYDKNPDSKPTILYSSPISEKDLQNIADGVYYFHVQLRNSQGWGAVSHFRFQIDTAKPDYFNITEIPRQDLTDPRAKFNFDSKDSLSGIDHYEIHIDNGDAQVWQDDGTHIFETLPTDPGSHTLVAKVFDRAGNFLAGSADFLINPLPQVIITDYPKQFNIGDTLIIKGKGPANSKIILFLQKDGADAAQYTGQSDENGLFVFSINDKFEGGSYKVWALAIDSRGAKSNPSEKLTILMEEPMYLKIGSFVISLISVLIPILALIFLLIFLILWLWNKLRKMHKKMKKDIHMVEDKIHKAFDILKEDVREQIKLIDKIKDNRPLTEIEEKIIKSLRKDLDKAEKSIEREVDNIEKARR